MKHELLFLKKVKGTHIANFCVWKPSVLSQFMQHIPKEAPLYKIDRCIFPTM